MYGVAILISFYLRIETIYSIHHVIKIMWVDPHIQTFTKICREQDQFAVALLKRYKNGVIQHEKMG